MTMLKNVFNQRRVDKVTATKQNHLRGTAVAASSATLAGFLLAVLTVPYGPTTTAQVWLVLISSLVIGLIAGWTLRNPWTMLLAPLAYIILFELARTNGVVPTTGGIRLDNSYGLLSLIVGRGFYGLIGLLPMVLGAGLAVFLTHAHAGAAGSPIRSILQGAPLVILALLVVALAVLNAIPASTPPILGEDGQPIPGSIKV